MIKKFKIFENKSQRISASVKNAQQYLRDLENILSEWLKYSGDRDPYVNTTSHIVFNNDVNLEIKKKKNKLEIKISALKNNQELKDLFKFFKNMGLNGPDKIQIIKAEKKPYRYDDKHSTLIINIDNVNFIQVMKDYINSDEFQLKVNVKKYNL